LEGAGVGALLETELDLPAVAAADDDAVATGLAGTNDYRSGSAHGHTHTPTAQPP